MSESRKKQETLAIKISWTPRLQYRVYAGPCLTRAGDWKELNCSCKVGNKSTLRRMHLLTCSPYAFNPLVSCINSTPVTAGCIGCASRATPSYFDVMACS